MKNLFVILAVTALVAAIILAQPEIPASSPAPARGELQELREAVRSLTDTVKQLQQQVKDQQAALEKANSRRRRRFLKIEGRPPWRPKLKTKVREGTEPVPPILPRRRN